MELTPRETSDLAHFIARRHPTRGEVESIARAARIELDDTLAGGIEAVWSTVIVEAHIQGRTRRLARVLRSQPDPDPRMEELCALLLEVEPVAASTRLLQASAVVVAVALLAAGALLVRGGDPVPVEPATATATAVADHPNEATMAPGSQSMDDAAGVADAPPMAVVAAPDTDGLPADATDAATQEPTPPLQTASVLPATTPTARRGCKGEEGEVVGYWYAGATAPGSAGDTITVPWDVNVRADYPDRHNDYDARTPVRCTLAQGDTITLGKDPILVPGDRYWVPLVAGGATSSSTSTP